MDIILLRVIVVKSFKFYKIIFTSKYLRYNSKIFNHVRSYTVWSRWNAENLFNIYIYIYKLNF